MDDAMNRLTPSQTGPSSVHCPPLSPRSCLIRQSFQRPGRSCRKCLLDSDGTLLACSPSKHQWLLCSSLGELLLRWSAPRRESPLRWVNPKRERTALDRTCSQKSRQLWPAVNFARMPVLLRLIARDDSTNTASAGKKDQTLGG